MVYFMIIAFFVNNKETIFSENVFKVIEYITKLGIKDINITK